jgi:hypothetical protein
MPASLLRLDVTCATAELSASLLGRKLLANSSLLCGFDVSSNTYFRCSPNLYKHKLGRSCPQSCASEFSLRTIHRDASSKRSEQAVTVRIMSGPGGRADLFFD